MKKIFIVLLACAMLVSVVACALPVSDTSVSSSVDTSEYAEFLANYASEYFSLETKAYDDRVVCGDDEVLLVTDTAAYGIDTADFASDAYMIRSISGQTVIMASAAAGLDRGVRRYAMDYMSEGGFCGESFSVTEGIGYRVGAIRIGGNDVSEYKIYTEADGNKSKAYAATELQDYISKTVGVILEITNTKPDGKYIELCFDRSENDALGTEGYRISVTDGILTIEGGERCGCLNGVYTFIEKYLGWRFLTDEKEYLYEADVIDLENGIDFTDLPALEYRKHYGGRYTNDFQAKMKGTQDGKKYGGVTLSHAHHGLYNYMAKAGYDTTGANPCFTADVFFEDMISMIREDLDSKISSGLECGIGKDFCMVDVGHLDTPKFCSCEDCISWMRNHGKVVSSTILYFTNKVAEVMQNEYSGIYVSCFAYSGTEVPPKNMTALDNVIVSYCFYIPCNNHCISGTDCFGVGGWNNRGMEEEFREWTKVAKRVDAWYYPWQNFGSFTTFNIYDDYKFLYEAGCAGPFGLMPGGEQWYLTFAELLCYMSGRMMWSADTMTEEEFHGLIKEFLYLRYGDSADYLYQIMLVWNDAGNRNGCWTGGHTSMWMDVVEHEYFAANYDHLCEMFDNALRYAPTSEAEDFIKTLSCTIHFLGISITYDDRYVNGTEDERAEIAERYRFMYDTLKEYKILPGIEGSDLGIPEELDIEVNPADWGWYWNR